jgi:4-amino-4-deoxy-L-arabinose transferase-like glycosyltransferase
MGSVTGVRMERSHRAFAEWLASPRINLIVAFAVLIRVAALAFLAHQPLVGDDVLYHDFAIRLLLKKSVYPLVPPAVGFYVGFFYRLFGTNPLVARACMLPLSVGVIYTLYAIAAKFAGQKGANLVALVFAIYPLYVLCSVEPITETPALLSLLISLFLVLNICAQTRLRDFVLVGLALGLLTLTRPSSLLMLGILPLYLAVRTGKWLASALVSAIPILMIATWILTVYNSTGHFVMINYSSTQNLFLGNNLYTPLYRTWWLTSHTDDESQEPEGYRAMNSKIKGLPWYQKNAFYRRVALQSITSRPDLFAVRTVNRIRVYFAFDSYTGSLLLNSYHVRRGLALASIVVDGTLYVLVMICAILFLFTISRNSERYWPSLTILGVIVIYAIPYFLSVAHPIYHYPVVPLFGLFAAALWSDILDQRNTWSGAVFVRGAKPAAMVLVLALFIYIQAEYAIVMYLYSSH